MKISRRKLLRILFQLLGLALFAIILTRVDLGAVLESYGRLSAADIAGGVAILVLFTLVKGIRWRAIVAAQGVGMSIPRAFKVYASSLYLGLITPGHVGDFAKAWYVRNAGLSIGRALWSSVLDRLFDLIFLVVIASASLLGLPGIIENQIWVIAVPLLVTAGTVVVCFFRRDLLRRAMKRLFSSASESGVRYRLDKEVQEGIEDFGLVTPRLVVFVSILTALAWMLHYAYFALLSRALGIGMSILHVIVCVSIAIFVALIPVSLSGLGTRDLALILIFGRIGLTREAAVAFSFSFISVFLVQGALGLLCWLSSPFMPRRDSA